MQAECMHELHDMHTALLCMMLAKENTLAVQGRHYDDLYDVCLDAAGKCSAILCAQMQGTFFEHHSNERSAGV